MFQFSGFLTAGYLVLDVFSAFLYILHSYQLLSLLWGIALVLVMGTAAFFSCSFALRALPDEQNGRTGVLSLSDDGFGCFDIGTEYNEAG